MYEGVPIVVPVEVMCASSAPVAPLASGLGPGRPSDPEVEDLDLPDRATSDHLPQRAPLEQILDEVRPPLVLAHVPRTGRCGCRG